jgi:hypothetical protein
MNVLRSLIWIRFFNFFPFEELLFLLYFSLIMQISSICLHIVLAELEHDWVYHYVSHSSDTLKSFLSKGETINLFEAETLKSENFQEAIIGLSLQKEEEIVAVDREK